MPSQRRLCGRDTNEHDEYRLLEAMSRRCAAERRTNGEGRTEHDVAWMATSRAVEAGSTDTEGAAELSAKGEVDEAKVALLAASQHLEVHFILEPSQEVVSGYVAIQRGSSKGSDAALAVPQQRSSGVSGEVLLHQLYVEPECRGRGFATTALKLLLAKTSTVALAAPSAAAVRLMEKVGFTMSQISDETSVWVSFTRPLPTPEQWEDARRLI